MAINNQFSKPPQEEVEDLWSAQYRIFVYAMQVEL